jgi:hypothetical protein
MEPTQPQLNPDGTPVTQSTPPEVPSNPVPEGTPTYANPAEDSRAAEVAEKTGAQTDYIDPNQVTPMATNAVATGGKAWLWWAVAGVITTVVILSGGIFYFYKVGNVGGLTTGSSVLNSNCPNGDSTDRSENNTIKTITDLKKCVVEINDKYATEYKATEKYDSYGDETGVSSLKSRLFDFKFFRAGEMYSVAYKGDGSPASLYPHIQGTNVSTSWAPTDEGQKIKTMDEAIKDEIENITDDGSVKASDCKSSKKDLGQGRYLVSVECTNRGVEGFESKEAEYDLFVFYKNTKDDVHTGYYYTELDLDVSGVPAAFFAKESPKYVSFMTDIAKTFKLRSNIDEVMKNR